MLNVVINKLKIAEFFRQFKRSPASSRFRILFISSDPKLIFPKMMSILLLVALMIIHKNGNTEITAMIVKKRYCTPQTALLRAFP